MAKPRKPREAAYEIVITTRVRSVYPGTGAAGVFEEVTYGTATAERAATRMARDAHREHPTSTVAIKLTAAGRRAAIARSAKRLARGATALEHAVAADLLGEGADA
jgi:hypothetical protein